MEYGLNLLVIPQRPFSNAFHLYQYRRVNFLSDGLNLYSQNCLYFLRPFQFTT